MITANSRDLVLGLRIFVVRRLACIFRDRVFKPGLVGGGYWGLGGVWMYVG